MLHTSATVVDGASVPESALPVPTMHLPAFAALQNLPGSLQLAAYHQGLLRSVALQPNPAVASLFDVAAAAAAAYTAAVACTVAAAAVAAWLAYAAAAASVTAVACPAAWPAFVASVDTALAADIAACAAAPASSAASASLPCSACYCFRCLLLGISWDAAARQ